ncbi:hypothetical protein BD779DRAFT_1520006 [Infundibulicybe gibba]|nr:hypothetical protein BD779DRAFT_1520006 [Infundibulicybe gibba]
MAAQAIKNFRLHELRGLPKHIARFGPLAPRQTDAVPPKTDTNLHLPNPFLPQRNPKTGKWSAPKYSLRRQAELVKKAKESSLVHLLPAGPKLTNPSQLASTQATPTSLDVKGTKNEKQELARVWMNPVDWEGKMAIKNVAGADIGTRLYAAKKRMFKGHKWERMKEGRDKKRKILMRDMARRVRNYKAYHKRRKPDPLKPSRSAKAPKLPF